MRSATLIALALAVPAVAADWPRFRGPNGTGVGDPSSPVDPSAANLAWKVPVPGNGHSSPVVAGGRVFVQSATATARTLHAFDAATGNELWARSVPGAVGHTHAKSSLASATPAVDGGKVFALFWDGDGCRLHAFDPDGSQLWAVPLGDFVSDHGAGMSPVAAGGRVFVVYDQGGKNTVGDTSAVLAFDGLTGTRLWSASRKAFRHCSASPVVRDLPGGNTELVVATTAGLTGYDPPTGRVNWDWAWAFAGLPLRTVGSPLVLADGAVVAVSGDGGGSRSAVCVRPGSPPQLLWEKRKNTPYVPTPLARDGHLYSINDDGRAACANAATGELVWAERVFSRPVSASPVLVGDAVLAVAEDGKTAAWKATPGGFDKVADGAVGEAVFATPAAAGGRLYVRGSDHLFCYVTK